MIRHTVHFSGRVQGVGFRYTTVRIGATFDVCGFVENLPDGRVRMVAEGERQTLDQFVRSVQEQMARYIRNTQIEPTPATGELGQPSVDRLSVRY